MAAPKRLRRNESRREVPPRKCRRSIHCPSFRWGAIGLVAFAAINLTGTTPAAAREGPQDARQEERSHPLSEALRSFAEEHPLALERGSGLSYTHTLRFGRRSFEVRARGPLARSAARRRFLGLQFELRF